MRSFYCQINVHTLKLVELEITLVIAPLTPAFFFSPLFAAGKSAEDVAEGVLPGEGAVVFISFPFLVWAEL